MFLNDPTNPMADQANQFLNLIHSQDNLHLLQTFLDNLHPEKKSQLLNTAWVGNLTVLSYIIRSFPEDEATENLLKLLITAGANPGSRNAGKPDTLFFCNTALLEAIAYEKWRLVLFLINQYDPEKHTDYINLPSLAQDAKNTPLIFACKIQVAPFQVFKALLTKGARINTQNHRLETALHYAAFEQDNELIKLFFTYHPDTTLINASGLTAYDLYQKEINFSRVIFKEKEGFPVINYRYQPEERCRAVPVTLLRQYLSGCSIDPIELTCVVTDDIYFEVEFVEPLGKKEININRAYDETIGNRLKPKNYNANALPERIAKISAQSNQQSRNITEGRFFLYTTQPEINELLDIVNNFIIEQTNSDPFLIMARFDLLQATDLAEAKNLCIDDTFAPIRDKLDAFFDAHRKNPRNT